VTAGAGGFVDITARGRRIVFSGMFNAGARMDVVDGRMKIRSEGKIKKLVPQVEQVSFSGPRALMQGQDITYITERCVMRLTPEGLTVTEIAPGISLQTDILDQSGMALKVSPSLRQMDARLYSPEPMGLTLDG
jgi:acyl CoA:acetate/3-ketoacid CoA transferase